MVVVNLADQPRQVILDLGEFAGHYTEVFSAEDRVLAAQEKLDLEPWAYKVYVSGTPHNKPAQRS